MGSKVWRMRTGKKWNGKNMTLTLGPDHNFDESSLMSYNPTKWLTPHSDDADLESLRHHHDYHDYLHFCVMVVSSMFIVAGVGWLAGFLASSSLADVSKTVATFVETFDQQLYAIIALALVLLLNPLTILL